MNKKGVFFTIITISLLSLFLISYSIYSYVNNRESINQRVKTMNNFVYLVEQDLPRKLYVSGFRGLFLIEKRISENLTYTDNVTENFEEFFFQGTIDGYIKNSELNVTEGVLFEDIASSFNKKANIINVNISMNNENVKIEQEDPWNVKFTLEVNIFIEDLAGLASWNSTKNFTARVPIEGFEDPVYTVNTNALAPNKINKTIYTGFSNTDSTNLSGHSQNSYYIESSSAPSFLMRLEGDLSSDINGVESLVNRPKLEIVGISTKDKSCVDHVYFNETYNPGSNLIQDMPNWFRLDNAHLSIYNATVA
ncbi:hypothetical protein GF386_00365 [Candidatus Pacearchaeota archaeon]|nr:hypothetical protein [Candidatus Pacearchaeota archaeon]MBD3282736.1 hypothetical protein [Candidatus Pacearchaeota archaeon]